MNHQRCHQHQPFTKSHFQLGSAQGVQSSEGAQVTNKSLHSSPKKFKVLNFEFQVLNKSKNDLCKKWDTYSFKC